MNGSKSSMHNRMNRRTGESWRGAGGSPLPPSFSLRTGERAIWFDGYVQTYLERDLQDIASIAALPDFRRVMRAASLRVGQMANQSGIGRNAASPQPTAHRYLNLLETSYLLVRVAPYSVNRTKRLIKSPKLYWGDVGVAMHLAQETEPRGSTWRTSFCRPARVAGLGEQPRRGVVLAHDAR